MIVLALSWKMRPLPKPTNGMVVSPALPPFRIVARQVKGHLVKRLRVFCPRGSLAMNARSRCFRRPQQRTPMLLRVKRATDMAHPKGKE
jgi:hypothetical protein